MRRDGGGMHPAITMTAPTFRVNTDTPLRHLPRGRFCLFGGHFPACLFRQSKKAPNDSTQNRHQINKKRKNPRFFLRKRRHICDDAFPDRAGRTTKRHIRADPLRFALFRKKCIFFARIHAHMHFLPHEAFFSFCSGMRLHDRKLSFRFAGRETENFKMQDASHRSGSRATHIRGNGWRHTSLSSSDKSRMRVLPGCIPILPVVGQNDAF